MLSNTPSSASSKSSPACARLSQAYLEPLLAGDRARCRQIIGDAFEAGCDARGLLTDLIWPTMELVQNLYREDRITISMMNLATRLNRSLTDQITARLTRKASNGRSVLLFCGGAETEELGGQICADLFEAEGYTVRFAGGGVPEDEVLKMVGDNRPDLLVLYGTLPSGVPAVRKLIDYLRGVNSCPSMQVLCCGGIYKRAEGLAEEMGADLYAPDAAAAVCVAEAHPSKKATLEQQTVGRTRRIRKAAARKTARTTTRAVRTAPPSAGQLSSQDGQVQSDECGQACEGQADCTRHEEREGADATECNPLNQSCDGTRLNEAA